MKFNKLTLFFIILPLMFTQKIFAVNHTLKLQDAVQIALEKNPLIKAGEKQIDAAKAKQTQTRSLYVPKVTFLTKYFYSNNLPGMLRQQLVKVPVMSASGPIAGQFVPMRPMAPYPSLSRDAFKADINLVYPLYTGGKIGKVNDLTKKLEKSYIQDNKQTKAEITYKVTTAFYNIVFLDQVIKVTEEAIGQLKQHLQLAQKAFEVGVRSELDIIMFQSKVKEFETKLTDIKGKSQLAKTALKNLLTLPMADSINCVASLDVSSVLQTEDEDILLNQILEGNHQLQSLKLKEKLIDNQTYIAKADKKPTVFMFANYHIYHGIDFPPFDQTWRAGYAVGVGLSMTLFDGKMSDGKIPESKANIERIRQFEKGYSLKLRFELKQYKVKMETLSSRLKSAEAQLKVAEKAYAIAKTSYENGVIPNVQLEDAQLNVIRVKTVILQIKKDALLEQANLEFLSGRNN